MTSRTLALPIETPQVDPRDHTIALSIVIPVYGNEDSLPELLERLDQVARDVEGALEVLFVVDGSPDLSLAILRRSLPGQGHQSRLLAHARNFGSFAAIRTGLERAAGDHIAVMAADLQEPPELVVEFQRTLLESDVDLVVGTRQSRAVSDRGSRLSAAYWRMYRRLVQPELPPGGVDVFACTARFRDELVALREANSSLVGLAFWLGFERAAVPYDRLERRHGSSGWSMRRKFRYLSDSVFSFTDLPIQVLLTTGTLGTLLSLILAAIVASARITGLITVPGYAAIIMTITFFAALNLFALGIIGAYVWRAFENTKQRPGSVVMTDRSYGAMRSNRGLDG